MWQCLPAGKRERECFLAGGFIDAVFLTEVCSRGLGERTSYIGDTVVRLNNKKAVAKCSTSGRGKGGRGERKFKRNAFVTRCNTMYAHHGLAFVLGWVRGKMDCFDSRDSCEGLGGVGRTGDGL